MRGPHRPPIMSLKDFCEYWESLREDRDKEALVCAYLKFLGKYRQRKGGYLEEGRALKDLERAEKRCLQRGISGSFLYSLNLATGEPEAYEQHVSYIRVSTCFD